MDKSSEEFILASNIVKKLTIQPDNNTMLKLYGLYKQAMVGNIDIQKPNTLNTKDFYKWKAWDTYKGLDKHSAEIKYIKLVNELIKKYGYSE
jgi:diazepam-binding inhibitor (GABA receptor modulating acyl-CoA-binding protein)